MLRSNGSGGLGGCGGGLGHGGRVLIFRRAGAGVDPRARPGDDREQLPGVRLLRVEQHPLALTAWQSLFEHARLRENQSILVNGAGGAVGGYAVQLARQAGATVTATAGARSAGRVRAYGADEVIDYSASALPQAADGRKFDVVLSLVRTSPAETALMADLTAEGGVFARTTFPDLGDPGRGVRVAAVSVRGDAAALAGLVARVDAGELRVDVAQRRPLSDIALVHDEAVTGRLAGKTVLIP